MEKKNVSFMIGSIFMVLLSWGLYLIWGLHGLFGIMTFFPLFIGLTMMREKDNSFPGMLIVIVAMTWLSLYLKHVLWI